MAFTSEGEYEDGRTPVGVKESQSTKKAPVKKLLRQFPLAVEQVAFRTLYGHEKYEKGDDWENWRRVPNSISEYEDAAARHNLQLNKEETEIEHIAAEIWNLMAVLQLKLEDKND